MIACCGDTCLVVNRLHGRFTLPEGKLLRLNACGDVKIFSQLCVLLKPVLIVRFQPVNLAILKGEESHSPVHAVIVFHAVHFIIFGQRTLQLICKVIIRTVADSEDIDTVSIKTVAEMPVSVWKIW